MHSIDGSTKTAVAVWCLGCCVQADFTPYEGKSVAAAVIDPESAAVQDHDMDLALALQMQEVTLTQTCIFDRNPNPDLTHTKTRLRQRFPCLFPISWTLSGQHCSGICQVRRYAVQRRGHLPQTRVIMSRPEAEHSTWLPCRPVRSPCLTPHRQACRRRNVRTVRSARPVSSRSSSSNSTPQLRPQRRTAAVRARLLPGNRLRQPGGAGMAETGLQQQAGTVRSRARLL